MRKKHFGVNTVNPKLFLLLPAADVSIDDSTEVQLSDTANVSLYAKNQLCN